MESTTNGEHFLCSVKKIKGSEVETKKWLKSHGSLKSKIQNVNTKLLDLGQPNANDPLNEDLVDRRINCKEELKEFWLQQDGIKFLSNQAFLKVI